MDKNQNIPQTLTWKAASHTELKRSSRWYIFFGIFSLGLIAYAYYSQSLLTAITFVLMIFVVLVISTGRSHEITYKITKTGIASGNTLYPFTVIKKFWIIYEPPMVKTLNFETTAYLNNKIVLQLGKTDPLEIKIILSQYLTEDLDVEESVAETLARRLKI